MSNCFCFWPSVLTDHEHTWGRDRGAGGRDAWNGKSFLQLVEYGFSLAFRASIYPTKPQFKTRLLSKVRASQQLLRKDSPSIPSLLRHQTHCLTQDWSRCCGALMKTLGRLCHEESAILTEERGPLKQSLGPKTIFRRLQWFLKSLERGTGLTHRGGRHTGSALAALPTRSHPLIPNDCSSAELFLLTWSVVRAVS